MKPYKSVCLTSCPLCPSLRTRPSSTRCLSGWRPVRSTCRRWSSRGLAAVRQPLALFFRCSWTVTWALNHLWVTTYNRSCSSTFFETQSDLSGLHTSACWMLSPLLNLVCGRGNYNRRGCHLLRVNRNMWLNRISLDFIIHKQTVEVRCGLAYHQFLNLLIRLLWDEKWVLNCV